MLDPVGVLRAASLAVVWSFVVDAGAGRVGSRRLHETITEAGLTAVVEALSVRRLAPGEAARAVWRDGAPLPPKAFHAPGNGFFEARVRVVQEIRRGPRVEKPPAELVLRYVRFLRSSLDWGDVVKAGGRSLLFLDRLGDGAWTSATMGSLPVVSRAPENLPAALRPYREWVVARDWGYRGLWFPEQLPVHFADEAGQPVCRYHGDDEVARLDTFTAWVPLEALARMPWDVPGSLRYGPPARPACPPGVRVEGHPPKKEPPPQGPDQDGDGVPDHLDRCPTKKGPAFWDGCPDTDLDGVPDHEDKCPDAPGPESNGGCPERKP